MASSQQGASGNTFSARLTSFMTASWNRAMQSNAADASPPRPAQPPAQTSPTPLDRVYPRAPPRAHGVHSTATAAIQQQQPVPDAAQVHGRRPTPTTTTLPMSSSGGTLLGIALQYGSPKAFASHVEDIVCVAIAAYNRHLSSDSALACSALERQTLFMRLI
eukprot:Opistho-2@61231